MLKLRFHAQYCGYSGPELGPFMLIHVHYDQLQVLPAGKENKPMCVETIAHQRTDGRWMVDIDMERKPPEGCTNFDIWSVE